MVKLAPRDVDRFIAQPDARVRGALIYGPDQGLVRERCQALVRAVAGDGGDPFRVATMDSAEVHADPPRLADEAAALSLVGGRRVVLVRNANDSVALRFRDFLAAPIGESLVVVEAGDLSARSSLRRTFESSDTAVAIACYHDDARSLPGILAELLRVYGLTASPDAMAYLVANLGGDRQSTQREIEKVATYMGAGEPAEAPRVVELEAAQACVGDGASNSLDDLVFAVGDGVFAALERALERCLQDRAQPVLILRAAARHFESLHLVAGLMAQGRPFDTAIKSLRRPVYWRYAARFRAQSASWPPQALGYSIDRLLRAEAACKRTGAPDAVFAARALLEIAAKAPARRAGVS